MTNDEKKIAEWLNNHKWLFGDDLVSRAIEVIEKEHKETRGQKKTPAPYMSIPYMEKYEDNSMMEDFFIMIKDEPVQLAKYAICLQEMGIVSKNLKPIAYFRMFAEYIPSGSRQAFWDNLSILKEDYPKKEKEKDKKYLQDIFIYMEDEYENECLDKNDYNQYLAELRSPDRD